MKKLLLFILLLLAGIGFAQNFEKDTIQLKEVFIGNKPPKKSKTVKKRFSGLCTFLGSVTYGYEMVTLIADLPEGYISSVTFDFNHKPGRKSTAYDFQDTGLQLIFFEVAPNGEPGKMIGEPLPFTVKGDEKGKLEIPVPYPLYKNPGRFFIGLRRVKPPKPGAKIDIEVDYLCDAEGYITYMWNSKLNSWVMLGNGTSIYKMTIKETVLTDK